MNTRERLIHEAKLLRTHFPEMKTQNAEFYRVLLKGGREYGYSADEMDQISDHRLLLVFRDALTHLGMWKKPE